MSPTLHLQLQLEPRERTDVIEVSGLITARMGDVLAGFPKVLYCSHHTTAGFFEQGLARRLAERSRAAPYLGLFQLLFPYGAGYLHDAMELRHELTEAERRVEPPNADAHLTFIGSGLQSCVTYENDPADPVLFADLDGVYQGRRRSRTASVLAYSREEVVHEEAWKVPISRHAVDSVNLFDRRLGLMQRLERALATSGVRHGCLEISLPADEQASAVTVNEYETLLMQHDLAEVLQNPLRFMAEKGRHVLSNPAAVPAKSVGYARYDAVRVMNRLLDSLGLAESAVERILTRLMAYPASRLLRFKRSLRLPLTTSGGGLPHLVSGRYQSPILIQWNPPGGESRTLWVRVHRLE